MDAAELFTFFVSACIGDDESIESIVTKLSAYSQFIEGGNNRVAFMSHCMTYLDAARELHKKIRFYNLRRPVPEKTAAEQASIASQIQKDAELAQQLSACYPAKQDKLTISDEEFARTLQNDTKLIEQDAELAMRLQAEWNSS